MRRVIRLGNIISRFIDTTNRKRIHVNRFLKVSVDMYDTENKKMEAEIRSTVAENSVPSGSRMIGNWIGEE